MVKILDVELKQLKLDTHLRVDYKFYKFSIVQKWNVFNVKRKNLIQLDKVVRPNYENFYFEEGVEYKAIPTGTEYIDEDGDINGWNTVTLDERPSRIKYKGHKGDYLLSSLKKARSSAHLVEEDSEEFVYSNGFYIFNKVSNKFLDKYLLYLFRSNLFRKMLDDHLCRGIGISAYDEKDFLKLRIPEVDIDNQKEALLKIEKIESRIREIKDKLSSAKEVIDGVLNEEFELNWNAVISKERIKLFEQSPESFNYRNDNLRAGYRWNKLKLPQSELYKNLDNIKKLGDYIIDTKNGWSPVCNEDPNGTPVLGIDSLKFSKVYSDNIKFTEEYREDIEKFYMKHGEFYVSRGNTIELVAMAGIAENLPREDIIYPDLLIRVIFNDEYVDAKYLAHVFNSSIGRLYFKYVSKGKNQTMVKISSYELNNFFLPLPKKKNQERIREKIDKKLNTLTKHLDTLDKLRVEIEEIVMNSLKA